MTLLKKDLQVSIFCAYLCIRYIKRSNRSFLLSHLSRKVEGLGPLKPWQPAFICKVPLPTQLDHN